ncbi:MAG: T9SS type A sorting domain-containing protein [Bacteroidales bacterium]|nr:T9SS type A sorting domain-containing protein [Bacteroidales bacterium]
MTIRLLNPMVRIGAVLILTVQLATAQHNLSNQILQSSNSGKEISFHAENINTSYFISMEGYTSLFEKIYFIDLIFNLSYIEPSYEGIGVDGVKIELPVTITKEYLDFDLEQIKTQVEIASNSWDKDEQGIYMAGASGRREVNLMNYVMGRDGTNDSCHKSFPFCTGTTYNFPAGVNSGTAQAGAYYDCLSTRPNPAWYHMKIGTSGNIIITMQSNPLRDIDFICWGPFTHPTDPCVAQLTAAKVVSCSYSTSATEIVTIPNGVSDEYYILLITNYSNLPCNISFSQTGGTGTTDCTIVPPPINNNGPLCIGDDLQLSVQNAIPGSTYSWTGPNGWSSTQQNPVIPNVNLSHAGTYTLIITLFGQTSDPVTTFVQIFSPPSPTVSGPQTACQGSSQNYHAVNPQQGSTFQWVATGGEITQGQGTSTATVLWQAAGSGSVRVTETPLYCSPVLSLPLNVTLSPLPGQPSLPTGPASICDGTTGVTYTTAGASNALSYTWSLLPAEAGNISGTGTSATVNWAPGFVGNASISVLGVNMCGPGLASDNLSVVVGEEPTANAGEDVSIPHGTATQLQGAASGAVSPYSYSWSPADKLEDPTIANPQTHNLFQTTVFTLTVTSANGCDGSDQVTVTITGGALGVDVGSDPEAVCPGGSSELNAFPSGGSGTYTYLWSSNPPGFTSTEQNPLVIPTQTTTYSVEISDGFNSANGATTVTVFSLPTAIAGNDFAIPHGTSTTLNGSGSGGTTPYGYSWTPSEFLVNPAVSNPQTINLYEPQTFSLLVTDENGCTSLQDAVTVNISGTALAAGPSAADSIVCPGFSTQLLANASGGSANYVYQWSSVPQGFTSTLENPIVFPLSNTIYHVSINDGFNVIAGEIAVEIAAEPLPSFTSDQVCFGEPTTLINQSSISEGSIDMLIWSYNGSQIGVGNELLYSFPAEGSHQVTLTAISDQACFKDITQSIFVKPLPEIELWRRIPEDLRFLSASEDTLFVCVFNTVTLDAGDPGNPNQIFSWSVGAETDTLAIGALGIGYELQLHTVTVTDTVSGCEKTVSLFIEFSMMACEFGIPGIDLNTKIRVYPNPAQDYLMIECTEDFDGLFASVYNTYGQLVVGAEPLGGAFAPQHRLNVSSLNPGVYFVRIHNFDFIHTVKLIISRY